MTALPDLPLLQMSAALRRGDFSSRELTQACLERIARLETDLHAFITLTPELALAQAEAADRRLAAWRQSPDGDPPPLLGVPLAIKDVLCLAGVRCTAGSLILEDFVAPYTATAVERLLSAGAVIVGKTNTDEFAMGSSTENSAYGPTRNPWDTGRVPGGSSGGSAAAVAARLVPAALGSDTGGSVRQPAAFCGLTGLKPTYGRVSRYGLIAYGSSLDCVGTLTHSAEEAATLLAIIAGRDAQDATSLEQPLAKIHLSSSTPLASLRIGVPQEYFVAGIQPAVDAALRQALQTFKDLGASLEPLSLPHTAYALPVYYLIAPAEASANLARYDGVRYGCRQPADTLWELFGNTRGQRLGAEVKRRIMLGTYALSAGYYDAWYGQAQRVRALIRQDFERAFAQVDVIAAPVTPTTAFALGAHRDDPLAMYLEDIFTLPANLAGVPGLAFPVGFDADGLPIGMQLMGRWMEENTLLQLAHTYQQVTTWHLRSPRLAD